MKILLTGSTGYIGRRLLPVLVSQGHHVVCLVRDQRRFDWEDFDEEFLKQITVIEGDLEQDEVVEKLPLDVEAGYYLVHSMTSSYTGFAEKEEKCAEVFRKYSDRAKLKHIIYLGGIINDENLSEHLQSRKTVEDILQGGHAAITILRAAIIIGSGSASFEILRDLVEKLPVMVAPRWITSLCQPIAVRNVIDYLTRVLMEPKCFEKAFDIGGPDRLSYKQMLLQFAKKRNLKRLIITLPILSPRLSSRWLYFVTSTSFPLARNLVDSMRHDMVATDESIKDIIPMDLMTYSEALEMAFSRISQKNVVSSWTDAISNVGIQNNFMDFVQVPQYGCFNDTQIIRFDRDPKEVLTNIWSIGGDNGWYVGTILWKLRGYLDQIVGGVGLRRGRRSPIDLKNGDALDFWRVLKADKKNRKLLLYAEMKLPGEAWLEFQIKHDDEGNKLIQRATFRPTGLMGRLYWYSVLPFHWFIFPQMARHIVEK